MRKYLYIDEMITPRIIKIVFWVQVISSLVAGLHMYFSPFPGMGPAGAGFPAHKIWGLLQIFGGVLAARIICEIAIVLFTMQEKTQAMVDALE